MFETVLIQNTTEDCFQTSSIESLQVLNIQKEAFTFVPLLLLLFITIIRRIQKVPQKKGPHFPRPAPKKSAFHAQDSQKSLGGKKQISYNASRVTSPHLTPPPSHLGTSIAMWGGSMQNIRSTSAF